MRPPSTRRRSGDLVKYATTAGSDTRDKNSHLLCTMHVVKGQRRERFVCTPVWSTAVRCNIAERVLVATAEPGCGIDQATYLHRTSVSLHDHGDSTSVTRWVSFDPGTPHTVYRAVALLFYLETSTDILGLLRPGPLFRPSDDSPRSPYQLSEATLYIKLSPPSHFIFNTNRRKSMDSGVVE